MSRAARVLLADHHPPSRAGVRQALEGKGFEICAEAVDAESAVEAAVRERPDVCLLEVELPGDGLAAAAQIASRLPASAVVMLTASAEDSDLFAALRVGASGYLLKDMNPERLPFALRGVMNGEAAVPRKLVARLIDDYRRRDRRLRVRSQGGPVAELTERESEVLDRMRARLGTAEIAEALSISQVTVRRHISEILKKLGVPDRESALRLIEAQAAGPDGAT